MLYVILHQATAPGLVLPSNTHPQRCSAEGHGQTWLPVQTVGQLVGSQGNHEVNIRQCVPCSLRIWLSAPWGSQCTPAAHPQKYPTGHTAPACTKQTRLPSLNGCAAAKLLTHCQMLALRHSHSHREHHCTNPSACLPLACTNDRQLQTGTKFTHAHFCTAGRCHKMCMAWPRAPTR